MKELLIISNEQFGYHIDSFKYCQYLKDRYDITYYCFYKGQEKIYIDGVCVVYVNWLCPKIIRALIFFLKALFYIYKCKGVTFIIYFKGFLLLHYLLPWKKTILDIRTLSVAKKEKQREAEDAFLRFFARKFSLITLISEGVRDKLGLTAKNTFILPLGADIISQKNKEYISLKLLYVGTLNGRNILDTVKGFHHYLQKYSVDTNITYDIVGDGEEKESIENYIIQHNLSENIIVHGYIHQTKLVPLFDTCNIGVAYVPITSFYDYQPATKTFEYVLSGLYTIATNTVSNREVISPLNGVLINDTVDSFTEALIHIKEQLPFNSENIRETLLHYRWSVIIDRYLCPILDRKFS